jgi:hypothetical protein
MVNKQRLYWGLQIGGWTLPAILQIIAAIDASGDSGVKVQRIILYAYEGIFCLLLSHGYRHFMNEWKWLSLSMIRLIPRVILSVFVLGAIMYVLRIPVTLPLGLFKSTKIFDLVNFLGMSLYYAIIFFIWTIFYFIYNYFERYNKSLKLEAFIKETELTHLKSQLNPHFIFNAMNSIRALVDENPTKSKEAINQLSNILRSTLASDKKGLTKFDEELKIVKDYLGLETIRFEERLKTKFDIDPESNDFWVPPLMIQTLVENGVKHGISKLTEGGMIEVKTKVIDDELKIQIRNSGHYHINGVKKAKGVGLANTIQRLKLLYGDAAYFRIVNEKDNFVLTEIKLPHLYNV